MVKTEAFVAATPSCEGGNRDVSAAVDNAGPTSDFVGSTYHWRGLWVRRWGSSAFLSLSDADGTTARDLPRPGTAREPADQRRRDQRVDRMESMERGSSVLISCDRLTLSSLTIWASVARAVADLGAQSRAGACIRTCAPVVRGILSGQHSPLGGRSHRI